MVTAVIVARGGSVRLPGKALLPFAGSTLIGHKVRTLAACKAVDRVVVGSDSRSILDEAEANGAEAVPRDGHHCDERACSANEMIADMVRRIGGRHSDVIVWAHPTNPLITAETYARAVDAYDAGLTDGHDSLASVYRIQCHAWYVGSPLNFNPRDERHRPAAELRPVLFQDGAIFVQTCRRFAETRYFYGSRPVLFETPPDELSDIDTRDDYEDACRRFSARAQPVGTE